MNFDNFPSCANMNNDDNRHSLHLTIVIPCFNEEATLNYTTDALISHLQSLVNSNQTAIDNFSILFVDDGSIDNTWKKICSIASSAKSDIKGIKLSRNVGQQNAIIAGLEHAIEYSDAIITLDADLQDDVNAITEMVEKFQDGCDIVFGIRKNRNSDSFLKKHTANLFYNLMKNTHTPVIPNHAEFRLLSKRAVKHLLEYPERNVFLRGIIPSMGFHSATVYYDRNSRKYGKSKYPLGQMLNFAVEGITSFSIRPIRSIFLIGIISLFLTMSVGIYVLIAILLGRTYPGWASLILSIWFLGSLILVALGIIGEYIGKIYMEVKSRPRYFIESTVSSIKK